MCPVIITCRSILWTLLTITTTLVMIASVMSPQWLIGYPRKPGLTVTDLENTTITSDTNSNSFRPTIGIINRCTRLHKFQEILKRESCAMYVTSANMPDSLFPDAWKASLAFFSVGCILLVFTMGTSVLSLCVQSMCGKSIFSVSGLIQSIAGKVSGMATKHTVMILSFQTDMPSLIRVYTVCHSVCIVWTHYSIVEPHSSNFSVICCNHSKI